MSYNNVEISKMTLTDFNNIQLSIEFRRRKKVEDKFPEIKNQIKTLVILHLCKFLG